MRSLAFVSAALALFGGRAAAKIKDSVTVSGNAFWVGSTRFYIRGVDYQPGGQGNLTDPLAGSNCLRDVPYMKELGLNTIRVYTVDNSLDHDTCMNALSDAGIYVILDVNTPKFAINREYPVESYNDIYLQHVFATVDVFGKYTNTLGFFAANEVVNAVNTTKGATIVKAVIRDMKAYIKKHVDRHIPVGYSAADVAENRMEIAHYLNCGADNERSEFHGVNDYSWCGDSSYTVSGYDQKVKNYTGYSIPLFMSEYGCNTVSPRKFSEVGAIYGEKMIPVFSGGLVYEWSQEPNNYGLVEIESLDATNVTLLPDYDNLKSQFKKNPVPTDDGGYLKDGSASECPEKSDLWEADNSLPAMPDSASKYLESGAGTPRGTNGPSNQWVPSSGASSPVDTGAAATSTATSTSKAGAAPSGKVENAGYGMWVAGVVSLATLVGALLL